MDTVLVTGAAGFAGSHLLELLAADADTRLMAWRRPGSKGHDAFAWSRALDGRVTWRAVDLLDRMAVREAVAEAAPSVVYHCAGAAHVGKAWQSTEPTFAVNVRGTHHLIEALRATGGRGARIVIPSSSLVYEAAPRPLTESDRLLPVSPYGLSKLAQEMVGTENTDGPDVLIARAFTHIGPRQDPWFAASGFARRIADIEAGRWAPEIQVGNLEAQRDLTDVRDTVRAYRVIAHTGRPGRVYNVCSGRALPIRRVLELLLARAHQPITIAVDPNRYRPNDHPLVVGDPARIHTELGWSAQIPIEQALDDLLAYWRARVREPSATGTP